MQTCRLYIEIIHNITGRKNISVIFKDPVSWVKKTSLTKEVAFLKKFQVFLLMFPVEYNRAKLVGDMRGNCFNILCQLLYN